MRITLAILLMFMLPAASLAAENNRIAVFDIEIRDAEKAISRPLSENLRSELGKSGKYEVIDRNRMEKILDIQKFQVSGCSSGQCMVDAGRLLGTDKMISGYLNVSGGMFHLSLSLVNAGTGKVEKVLSDTCKYVTDDLVDLSSKLVRKLIGVTGQEPFAATGPGSGKVSSPSIKVLNNSYRDPVTDMEFVFVKGGCYQMGDSFGDGDNSEKPLHEVCLNDFWIGKYEVTQGQWTAIMGNNPSFHKNCGDNCPVENVSWNDAQEFVSRLNGRGGFKTRPYRLPTEAEWEYAARSGGKKEKWSGTSSEPELGEYSWYHKNSEKKTHPVGQKKSNGLGLYDMSGNVWEWVSDRYKDKYYYDSSRDNPKGPITGHNRVTRGGSWSGFAGYLRATDRGSNEPNSRSSSSGFRCLMPE